LVLQFGAALAGVTDIKSSKAMSILSKGTCAR